MDTINELIQNQRQISKLTQTSTRYKGSSTYFVTDVKDEEGNSFPVFITLIRYDSEIVFYTNADRFRQIVKLYLDSYKVDFGSGSHPVYGLDPEIMTRVLKEIFKYVHEELVKARDLVPLVAH